MAISATALDRLLGDPYQFYAAQIMGLKDLDALDAEPSAQWQGTVAHAILQSWHETRERDPAARLAPIMQAVLDEELPRERSQRDVSTDHQRLHLCDSFMREPLDVVATDGRPD